MRTEITVTAKSVEEALEKAVSELGAQSAEEITYEVEDEGSKGFFGLGAKEAKIHAVYERGNEFLALDMLEQLGNDMGVELTLTMREGDNDDYLIEIEGEGAGALIGHHGETLDALQYLANLAANKKQNGEKQPFVKITVDIAGYRAKREETLRALARRKAEQVLKYKRSIVLEPMNPYERRIIHAAVQEIEGVSTNSIGSDNNRKVVMFLNDKGGHDEREPEYEVLPEEV